MNWINGTTRDVNICAAWRRTDITPIIILFWKLYDNFMSTRII
jgi:hypothetical protein